MTFSILFPSSYSIEVSKLRQQLDEAHLAWAKVWKQRQADFRLENIRFVHDPGWNKRFFSLQAARDGGSGKPRIRSSSLAGCRSEKSEIGSEYQIRNPAAERSPSRKSAVFDGLQCEDIIAGAGGGNRGKENFDADACASRCDDSAGRNFQSGQCAGGVPRIDPAA